MGARSRTYKSRRGGAPISDTPQCDIEFPLELRKWREMEVYEPIMLPDYNMTETEFWERANRVAEHYQDCSKRSNKNARPENAAYAIEKGSGFANSYRIRGFLERVIELNPLQKSTQRGITFSTSPNYRYQLFRAVREAERQCLARKPNINAFSKKIEADRKNTLKKKWAVYNTGRAAWLRIKAEADAVKEEILSFGEIRTFVGNILLNEIKACLSKDDFECLKGLTRKLQEEKILLESVMRGREGRKRLDPQKQELLNLLEKYVTLEERYIRSKTNFNKNTNRNAYYESERRNREASRADELSGLF